METARGFSMYCISTMKNISVKNSSLPEPAARSATPGVSPGQGLIGSLRFTTRLAGRLNVNFSFKTSAEHFV